MQAFQSSRETGAGTARLAPALPHRPHLIDQIGHTPLVQVTTATADLPGVEIWSKLEYFNPGGSVKDRPARRILEEAISNGRLRDGKTILDATSGNTGIAYAMLGASLGHPVKLCLPSNASPERKRILNALGAELVLTDPGEGSDGAIRRVRELNANDPERYFYADQYNNDANWRAHYDTTAPEILEQTRGRITHFVALLGTSGTFMGTTRRLKRESRKIECWSAQPATAFHGIEGTKHMPSAIRPGIYDETLGDGNLWIETEACHAMARKLAREAGLLVGISAAGNIVAARELGKQLVAQGRNGVIVTIACDGASKYLSEEFWHDPD